VNIEIAVTSLKKGVLRGFVQENVSSIINTLTVKKEN
jgi:hypothetical protein